MSENETITESMWAPEHAQVPQVTQESDMTYRINCMRDSLFRTNGKHTIQFTTRVIHVEEVKRIEIVIAPLWGYRFAHTFLVFHFSNTPALALSFEARRKQGERFTLRTLIPRQFPLIAIWGTERDVVHLRKRIWKIPIVRFSLRLDNEKARRIVTNALERTKKLQHQGEWYHLLWNNCTNNMIELLRKGGVTVPWLHWRYYLSSSLFELFRGHTDVKK